MGLLLEICSWMTPFCKRTFRGGARNSCLGVQKFRGLGDRGTPPPWQSHWICTISTSATGRRSLCCPDHPPYCPTGGTCHPWDSRAYRFPLGWAEVTAKTVYLLSVCGVHVFRLRRSSGWECLWFRSTSVRLLIHVGRRRAAVTFWSSTTLRWSSTATARRWWAWLHTSRHSARATRWRLTAVHPGRVSTAALATSWITPSSQSASFQPQCLLIR